MSRANRHTPNQSGPLSVFGVVLLVALAHHGCKGADAHRADGRDVTR